MTDLDTSFDHSHKNWDSEADEPGSLSSSELNHYSQLERRIDDLNSALKVATQSEDESSELKISMTQAINEALDSGLPAADVVEFADISTLPESADAQTLFTALGITTSDIDLSRGLTQANNDHIPYHEPDELETAVHYSPLSQDDSALELIVPTAIAGVSLVIDGPALESDYTPQATFTLRISTLAIPSATETHQPEQLHGTTDYTQLLADAQTEESETQAQPIESERKTEVVSEIDRLLSEGVLLLFEPLNSENTQAVEARALIREIQNRLDQMPPSSEKNSLHRLGNEVTDQLEALVKRHTSATEKTRDYLENIHGLARKKLSDIDEGSQPLSQAISLIGEFNRHLLLTHQELDQENARSARILEQLLFDFGSDIRNASRFLPPKIDLLSPFDDFERDHENRQRRLTRERQERQDQIDTLNRSFIKMGQGIETF